MASKQKYIYRTACGSFVYQLKAGNDFWLYASYFATIIDFVPNRKEISFPATVDGHIVTKICLEDKVWAEVTSLSFPDIETLGLHNDSFPALQKVRFPSDSFYTDGRMIYSPNRSKLFFSLAGREDEVIHVPDYVTQVDNTAFSDSRCRDIVFENPKVKIDPRTFLRSTYLKNHPMVILGDKLICLGDDIPVLELSNQVKKIDQNVFTYHSPHTLRAPYLPDLSHADIKNHIKVFELTSPSATLPVKILTECYPSLSLVKVPEDHFRYEIKEGVLYDKRTKKLLYYPPFREGNTYKIEEGTLGIGPYAFYSAQYLEEVKIPDSVKDIGSYAFCSCPVLQRINLPSGIEGIPRGAHYVDHIGTINNCPKLKDLILPQGLTFLGYRSIYSNSTCMQKVILPDTMEYLGDYCLPAMKDAEVHLPASLLVASHGSLSGCEKVWAYEGTARGLVLAINNSIEIPNKNDTWRDAIIDVLDKNGKEKAILYIPSLRSMEGRKALVMTWDSEEIDYDAYDIAFRHVEEDNIAVKLLMALLLVLDGGLKGAALDYLHENKHLTMAGSLLIHCEDDIYFDRYLALEGFTLSDIDELLEECQKDELVFFRERLEKKKKEMEGGR